jgi:hypothetical protein
MKTSPKTGSLALFTIVLLLGNNTSLANPVQPPGTYWLNSHGFQLWEWDIDHDGDGFTAREEYRFGTDPRNRASLPVQVVPLVQSADTEFHFTWDTVPGVTYQAERSVNLQSFAGFMEPVIGDGL